MGCLVWTILAIYAHRGMAVFIPEIQKNLGYESSVYWWVGPDTRETLRDICKAPYTISVYPFDWVESGRFVTHTVFVRTETQVMKIRVRFNPLHGYFHVVGYATNEKK
jgi:hypothetical protein